MADYFPLISRAVSGLDPNTAERRLAIYARAKEALDRQLRSLDPPISTEDLARESAALDSAIARLEAQFAAPPVVAAPPPPAPPVVTAPPPPRPAMPAAPRPAPQPPAMPAPPAPVSRPAPPITSATIPRPQTPAMPARPAPPASETVLAPSITSASIPRPQPPQPTPARPTVPGASPPPAPPAPPVQTPAQPAPQDGLVHVPAGGTHIIIDTTENEALSDIPLRPKVTSETSRGFAKRKGVILAIAIGVPAFLGIGALAYILKDDPSLFRPQEKEQTNPDAAGGAQRKASGRLDGSGSAPASGPRRPPQETSPLPVATRVVYFEELAEDARGKQSEGQVVWRLDTIPGGSGAAPVTAVRGSVTIPDAKMSMEMLVRVNREATLPASHTVEITFKPQGERPGVVEIGPIEGRDQETQAGYQLKGAMVPVGENLFLIGLDKTEMALVKNIEAIRDRRWFAFQFRLKDNRIGAVLIEKGPTGERAFKDAIASWGK